MMVYSLARYRHLKPAPPFALGGTLHIVAGEYFLGDALGSHRVVSPSGALSALEAGDLVTLQVQSDVNGVFTIDSARTVYRPAESHETPAKPQALRFAEFVSEVRRFFKDAGLVEVFTPTLVKCPGLEPALEPFSTELKRGRRSVTAYLPTSPEVSLKKAMSLGNTDIFEIKNCFRREESSPHHENEFLMLEWYRGFADLEMILSDLELLLESVATKGWVSGAKPVLRQTDFATLFHETFLFELTPLTTADDLRALCRREKIEFASNDHFADLFHRLLIERIEPRLMDMGPVAVRRFPPSMAALARLDDDGWADRVEFYWRGLEIANGFNEVTDPAVQKERWQMERDERRRLGRTEVPEDPTLIAALERGLPPSGGIALGLERLYMACTGVREIRELRFFGSADLF